jgi:hypothetical protein
MISELTEEQKAMENVIVEKWIQKAFRTTPITDDEARVAVESLYKMLGEPNVPYTICPGPLAAWKKVCELTTDDPQKRRELEKTVVLPLIDGIINAGYYAYLDFLDYIGVEVGKLEEVKLYRTLANVSWVWPLENHCVLCDHPLQLHVNAAGNLHNESGPSVEYRDGLRLWNIEGVDVDEQIVMRPHTQTIKQIFADTNADRQSIRLARFGWLRVLQETNAVTIDERPNDIEGTYEVLYEARLNGRQQRILVATCITGKIPAMPVPNTCETCADAQRWLKGDVDFTILGRT